MVWCWFVKVFDFVALLGDIYPVILRHFHPFVADRRATARTTETLSHAATSQKKRDKLCRISSINTIYVKFLRGISFVLGPKFSHLIPSRYLQAPVPPESLGVPRQRGIPTGVDLGFSIFESSCVG